MLQLIMLLTTLYSAEAPLVQPDDPAWFYGATVSGPGRDGKKTCSRTVFFHYKGETIRGEQIYFAKECGETISM